ncbi:MAG: hypothetical protein ACOYOF_15350 [Verrucomicrobiaceae bacterium]
MKPYVEALILSNDGDELCDASDDLKELVKAVREHGGKGHVTVKITVGGIGKIDPIDAIRVLARDLIEMRKHCGFVITEDLDALSK